jgi:hypothetical protein
MESKSNTNTNVGKLDNNVSSSSSYSKGFSNNQPHHNHHQHYQKTQQNLLSIQESFDKKAKQFIKKTEDHALQGLNPGGIYQAIWCRDASFILKSWYHSGNIDGLLQQISTVWSHQIESGKEKIVYGRGSPEMNYKPTKAKEDIQKKFEGALPTTIYQAGYSEVYGLNPDLDSTALMISTTSWILTKILNDKNSFDSNNSVSNDDTSISSTSRNPASAVSKYSRSKSNTSFQKVVDFVTPRMIKAIDYLQNRDIDNDGLLEQNHNEDWMDTGLRAGKIVYSQACYILALNNLAYLLSEIGKNSESKRMIRLCDRTIHGVENKLWLEEANSYVDILESHHIGGPYRVLTQDVALYLVAISENTNSDTLRIHQTNNNDQTNRSEHPLKRKGKPEEDSNDSQQQEQRQEQKNEDKRHDHDLDLLLQRANKTLDSIKERVWLNKWPTNIETLLKASGPLHLKPYFYHNRTFWPWITGIEMTARSRFDRFDECNTLLSKLTSEDDIHILTFYEWVNPKTGKGGGAYPFRTGVCTVRNAIDHIIEGIEKKR